MNPYEPKTTIVHREAQRVVDIHVYRRVGSGEQRLMLLKNGGVDSEFVWLDVAEGVVSEPFLTLSEEVYGAIRSSLVGDKLEEREFLRGRIQELERSLSIERDRVNRLLP